MSARFLIVTSNPARFDARWRELAIFEEFSMAVSADLADLDPNSLLEAEALLLAETPSEVNIPEFLKRVRSDFANSDLPVIVAVAPTDRAASAIWAAGASSVIEEPAEPHSVFVQARNLVKARRARSTERRAIRDLHNSVRRLADVILDLADAVTPGLRIRGDEVSWIAGQMAARFNVPGEFLEELVTAARLHGVGSAFLRERSHAPADPWRWASATAGELRQIPALSGVAELVTLSAEHWDGSGRAGLQRGQIPLRARIIRVSVDLVEEALAHDPEMGSEALRHAAHALSVHKGTRYDPAVVAELELLFAEQELSMDRVRWVSVEDLKPGMKLAEDLVTASGVKLLAAGGVISAGSLRTITRRHVTDPIAHAIPVETGDR